MASQELGGPQFARVDPPADCEGFADFDFTGASPEAVICHGRRLQEDLPTELWRKAHQAIKSGDISGYRVAENGELHVLTDDQGRCFIFVRDQFWTLKPRDEFISVLDADVPIELEKFPNPLMGVRSWAERIETTPQPEFVIPQWLPRGLISTLFGKDGTGKNFVMMRLGMQMACGRRPLDIGLKRSMRTLFISAEDTDAEIASRFRRLRQALNLSDREFELVEKNFVMPGLLGTDTTLLKHLPTEQSVQKQPFWNKLVQCLNESEAFDLLILDPIGDLFAIHENDAQQVRLVMFELQKLAIQHNIAVMLIGHPAKHEGSEYGGSRAFSSKSRSRWFLEGGENELVLSNRKNTGAARPNDVMFRWDSELGVPAEVARRDYDEINLRHRNEKRQVIAKALRRLVRRDITTSSSTQAGNYAPKMIVENELAQGWTAQELSVELHIMIEDKVIDTQTMDGEEGRPKVVGSTRKPRLSLWPSKEDVLIDTLD